jgi:hypothetical protein
MTATLAAAAGGHSADAADAKAESGIVWIYHFEPDGSATLVANDKVEQALANHVGWMDTSVARRHALPLLDRA